MLTVPEEIKTLFQSDSIKKEVIVSFPNGELPDILCDQIVQDTFTFEESICSRADLQLGLCEASYVQFECVGIGNITDYKIKVDCLIDVTSLGEDWVSAYAETREDVPFPFYSIPYGIFYVDSCAKKSGATKNHRTVKAFTREAQNNWEIVPTLVNVQKLGWRTNKTLKIPFEALKATYFADSITKARKIYYPRSSGGDTQLVIRFNKPDGTVGYFPFVLWVDSNWTGFYNETPELKSGYSETVKVHHYDAKISNQYKNEVLKVINGVVEKMKSAGCTPFQSDLDSVKRRALNIRLEQTYPIKIGYEYHNANYPTGYRKDTTVNNSKETTTEYYPTVMNVNIYEHVIAEYLQLSSTVREYYQSTNVVAHYDVPYGFVFRDSYYYPVIREFVPDGYEIDRIYTFDYSRTAYFLYDFEPSDYDISYPLENTFTSKGTTKETNKADVAVNVKGYVGKESINFNPRELIEAEAELAGLLGRFNRYGGFEYISLRGGMGLYPREDLYPKNTLYPQEPSAVILPNVYVSAEWEDKFNLPYDRVSVDYTNTDGDTVYAFIALVDMDDPAYDPRNYQSYTLGNNYYIKNRKYTEAQITQILEDVANNIRGLKYMPSEVVLRGLPYIEAGDYVEFLTEDSGLQTIVLRNTINGEMYLEQVIESN